MASSGFTLNERFNPKGQAQLILKSAGLSALKVKFYNTSVNDKELQAQEEGINNSSVYDNISRFGLPIFDVLEFDSLNYEKLDGTPVSIESLQLGIALIEVNQTKNIVTTSIQGKNGTVKEWVSDGDYNITIRGALVGDGNEVKPQGKKNVLVAFCQAPVRINVACPLLNDFGIYSMVINSYSFPQKEGYLNVVPFELNCLSDYAIELETLEFDA